MSPRYHLTLLALLVGGIATAGCASNQAQSTRPAAPTNATPTAPAPAGAAKASKPRTATATTAKPAGTPLPDNTGIPACDDYLASYVACHRAAAIYAPDQIESHYEDMRSSLLRDSQDPAVRPQLGARCTSLAVQLKQALHGKSCGPLPPAPAGSASGSH